MDRPSTAEQRTSLVSAASVVMAAMLLSRVLGLLRTSLLGSTFGAGAEQDAFVTAMRVPDTLYILVAGGALASAFIPTFTAYMAGGERRVAWQVGSAVTNLVFLVSLVASLVTAALAPWVVSTLLAPGYEPPEQALTVSLLRWMLPSTVIFSVSGLLMGILNAHNHFLLPALAPSMYNLGIIGGTVLLSRTFGIYGAAIGTVAGALLHLLIQLPALRGLDWTYTSSLGLHLEGVRHVGRLMAPRALGLAITQLNFWINTNLGSRIPVEGTVTALQLGFSLMLLPHGIFAQAIATVLFPSFSAQAARQERDALRTMWVSASLALLYVTLPATVGLILLRQPLVQMFFMRGEFDPQDVAMVAWALAWFAVGLVAHSELEIVTRAFYALHDTATPVWVGGAAMTLNVVLSLLLSWLFAWLGNRYFPASYQPWMPLGGLALANSLATLVETLTLSWLLRRRLGGGEGQRWAASLWRTAASAAAMGAVLFAWQRLLPVQNPWVLGVGGILAGAGAFFLVSLLLRSPELDLAWQMVRRRWAR